MKELDPEESIGQSSDAARDNTSQVGEIKEVCHLSSAVEQRFRNPELRATIPDTSAQKPTLSETAAHSGENIPGRDEQKLSAGWRDALERIAVLCAADFDPSNPAALVEQARQFVVQLVEGINAKDRERAEFVEKIRAAVREGWNEVREVREANRDLAKYVSGLTSGSNTVAAYVYRALHDTQL